jgi:hypothetical protein
MVSMKTPPDDSNEATASSNQYGYGLRIRLNDDQCEALGITTPPAAGSKMNINAVAFVASATQSVEDDGDDAGNDVYLELQITDMELSTAKGVEPSTMLYGSGS